MDTVVYDFWVDGWANDSSMDSEIGGLILGLKSVWLVTGWTGASMGN